MKRSSPLRLPKRNGTGRPSSGNYATNCGAAGLLSCGTYSVHICRPTARPNDPPRSAEPLCGCLAEAEGIITKKIDLGFAERLDAGDFSPKRISAVRGISDSICRYYRASDWKPQRSTVLDRVTRKRKEQTGTGRVHN